MHNDPPAGFVSLAVCSVAFKSETTIKPCAAMVNTFTRYCCFKTSVCCYACIYYAVAQVMHWCERMQQSSGGYVVNEAKFLSPPALQSCLCNGLFSVST